MNYFLKRIGAIFLGGAILSPSLQAVEPQAYMVDSDGAVLLVDSKGKTTAKSSQGQALDVSYGADGTVWVLTPDPGSNDRGGNLIAYQNKGSSNWITVRMKNNKEAVAMSGDKEGYVWFVDGDERRIWRADKHGNASTQGIGGSAHMMAVSAELKDQIWAISRRATIRGNPVTYSTVGSGQWHTSQKSSGINLSGYWVVTNEGQIVTIKPDSPKQTQSPQDFATDVSVGPSGQVWVVSVDPYESAMGGAVLKIWDQQGNKAANWVTVPNIGATKVSAK